MNQHTPHPLAIEGLSQPLQLWRDAWGIPHIKANNERDVFIGLGYAHAQDRLWQMDMLRRRGYGRWAEWRGTEAIEADRLARRLGGESVARRDYDALGKDARTMLDSYTIGVNAFIALAKFPVEYALLEARPEAWRPWDSIAAMRQIGFLMGSFWLKLFRAAALPAIGADAAAKLRYDDGGQDLLCIPQGVENQRWEAALAELRPAIAALLDGAAPDLTGGGSNNWAISGDISATGRPILMGDPHRELEVPSMYAQAHIACDAFDAIGLTVPGVPAFPHVAHNGHVAWCVTHAFVDIHDLYIERFRDHGRQSLFRDQWEPVKRRVEQIHVRGSESVDVEVLETRHGPVIAGDPASGTALVLRSVQFAESDVSFDCLPRVLKSKTVPELFASVDDWGLIDHNLVAADTAGHIGHRVRGKVPARPRSNGWLPVPGWTGEYEWQGMLPPNAMPVSIDPPDNRIITANNRVVANDSGPYLCTDCHPPHRARRIAARLDALDSLSAETMQPIFEDLQSIPALLFRDRLRELTFRGKAEDLRRGIAAWNGEMTLDSTIAASYARFRLALTDLVFEASHLAEAHGSLTGNLMGPSAMLTHLWWVVPTLLRNNDETLLGGQTWRDLLEAAMEQTAKADTTERWADVHAPVLQHPLSPVFPDAASRLNIGCAPIGGDNDTVFATGYIAGEGLATKYSALARYVFDVGAWDNSRWIVFQGASGQPGDAHRGDQNELWATCTTIPMLYAWSIIEEIASRTDLNPG
jgi:penicillin G amidase